MQELQIFNNPAFGQIRTAITENGDPLFCLSDLCKAVSLLNPSSVKSRLDSNDVQLIDLHALKYNEGIGNTTANFVNESGFYDVLLQSNSPSVKPFRKWVTSEVLPSIRKHGMYANTVTMENMLNDPDFAIRLLGKLKEEKDSRMQAEQQVVAMQPKVLFADAVATSNKSILIGELAKILRQNGYEIGGNRLFENLRQKGYLCLRGESYNQPTQRAMDMGLFEMKKTSIHKPDGTILVTTTTKVTGKGQLYFINKFLQPIKITKGC